MTAGTSIAPRGAFRVFSGVVRCFDRPFVWSGEVWRWFVISTRLEDVLDTIAVSTADWRANHVSLFDRALYDTFGDGLSNYWIAPLMFLSRNKVFCRIPEKISYFRYV